MHIWSKVTEIVIPELNEMRTAHIVSIGSETVASLNPDCNDGYVPLHFFYHNTFHCLFIMLCEMGFDFVSPEDPLFYYEGCTIKTVILYNFRNLVIPCK